MDETDTGATTSPEAMSAEAARQWAEQQRAQARAHFDTPSWLGPTRSTAMPAQVPAQAEPDHDELVTVSPLRPADPIPDAAHWAERRGSRLLAGTVLTLALLGVLGFLALAISEQSIEAIGGLVACAFVAVIFRGALISTGVTTVDLKGSMLRIRKGGVLDVVNLADPGYRVSLVGTPDQPTWRLRSEAVDGRVVELGPRQVDAAVLHRVVEYYRAVAERDRRDRERRFNR